MSLYYITTIIEKIRKTRIEMTRKDNTEANREKPKLQRCEAKNR